MIFCGTVILDIVGCLVLFLFYIRDVRRVSCFFNLCFSRYDNYRCFVMLFNVSRGVKLFSREVLF